MRSVMWMRVTSGLFTSTSGQWPSSPLAKSGGGSSTTLHGQLATASNGARKARRALAAIPSENSQHETEGPSGRDTVATVANPSTTTGARKASIRKASKPKSTETDTAETATSTKRSTRAAKAKSTRAASAGARSSPARGKDAQVLVQEASSPEPMHAVQHAGAKEILLIIDGNYLANRSYFGFSGRPLQTSSGVPTSITFGVIKTLQAALNAVQPAALAVVFDPPGPTFRSAVSLLDPTGAAGIPAARLIRSGRLNWQDLATRVLSLKSIEGDILRAAAAEAAATPASFLHSCGSFLAPPPDPDSGDDDDDAPDPSPAAAPRLPAAVRHAAAAREVLVAALGAELADELGLREPPVSEAAAEALLLPSYKAGRTPHGEDFHQDLKNLQRLLGLMSVKPLCRPWLEADDLVGLLVQEAVQQGMAVRIVSGDRDLMQLVDDATNVSLLYPAKPGVAKPGVAKPGVAKTAAAATVASTGDGGSAAGGRRRRATADFAFDEYREADVVASLGVAPCRVVDYKALTGDGSDQLPGINGIGPKTAVKLLGEHGSLRGIQLAVGDFTAKRQAAIQADLPAALYTQAMARVLGTSGAPPVPGGVFPEDLLQRLRLRGFDPALVLPALMELELRSLARGTTNDGELWRAFKGKSRGCA